MTPDEAGAINAVLARLTTEHREIIVLHDIEGFTHEEIAAALEIEPGTSKSGCRAPGARSASAGREAPMTDDELTREEHDRLARARAPRGSVSRPKKRTEPLK